MEDGAGLSFLGITVLRHKWYSSVSAANLPYTSQKPVLHPVWRGRAQLLGLCGLAQVSSFHGFPQSAFSKSRRTLAPVVDSW